MQSDWIEPTPQPDEELPLPTIRSALPASLRETTGRPPRDRDCTICQEPIEKYAFTTEHGTCKRHFHDSCIRRCLDENKDAKCPVCRGPLWGLKVPRRRSQPGVPADKRKLTMNDIPEAPEMADFPRRDSDRFWEDEFWDFWGASESTRKDEMIKDRSFEERVDLQLEYLETMPEPVDWYVALDEKEVRNEYSSIIPARYRGDIKIEIELCLEVLETRDTTSTIQKLSSKDLIEDTEGTRARVCGFDFVWMATRVFGITQWFSFYLITHEKFDQAIAFWMPYPETVKPLWHVEDLKRYLPQYTYDSLAITGFSTDLVQLPLPTQMIVDHLRLQTGTNLGNDKSGLTEMKEIARAADKHLHWALIKIKVHKRVSVHFAVPWPMEAVRVGLEHLRYPGWSKRKTYVHYHGGWEKSKADKMLANFLEERKTAFRRLQDECPVLKAGRNKHLIGPETVAEAADTRRRVELGNMLADNLRQDPL